MSIIIGYTFMALIATFLGAITGIGGGVIMKPIMDIIGTYDSATVATLSSITVFAMALSSIIQRVGEKVTISPIRICSLSFGSIVGGLLGQYLFGLSVENISDGLVKTVQNSILLIVIILIFIYMILSKRGKISNFNLSNPCWYGAVGLLLGVISSFLGIGGGPINVVLLMLLFNLDIKTATFGSIVTILFSQASKITTIAIGGGLVAMDLTVLPYMIIAAVVGAFLGSYINKKVSNKTIAKIFNIMQLIIMAVCLINIVRYSVG